MKKNCIRVISYMFYFIITTPPRFSVLSLHIRKLRVSEVKELLQRQKVNNQQYWRLDSILLISYVWIIWDILFILTIIYTFYPTTVMYAG